MLLQKSLIYKAFFLTSMSTNLNFLTWDIKNPLFYIFSGKKHAKTGQPWRTFFKLMITN